MAKYKPWMFHTAFALNGLFTVSLKTLERLGAPAVVVLLYRWS
jgi:hypothetical protein